MYEKISSDKFQPINAEEMQSISGGAGATCDQVTVTPSGNSIDPFKPGEREEADQIVSTIS